MSCHDHGSALCRALEATVNGDADAVLELFTEDVHGWSPSMVVASRADLLDTFSLREDALTDAELRFDAVDVVGNKAIVEWRARAVFSGPFLVDDDLLIEPNGHELAVAGVTIAEFEGDKIRTFRNYFDDAAFLEQMLVAP